MPPKKSRKKLVLIILGLAAAAAGAFFYFRSRQNLFPDQSAVVTRRSIREVIELSGEVSAESYANLHFPAGGLVTYAPFQEGDSVNKWATVASLDPRELEKTLTKQLNLYSKERHDFDTTQDTYQKERQDGDVDQALRRILESAQYDLDNSVIDVEIKALALKLSRLSSPLTGILVSSPITTPNLYVSASDTWYIVDPSSLTFTADLDESDLALIETGQEAEIKLDAYPDLVLSSQVERVAYQSKLTTTGTIFEVTIPLPLEHARSLRLGLNGNVSILRQVHPDVLTIPIESVKESLDRTVVTVDEGGKPIEREIKLGVADDRYYQVLEGLSDGEKIYYGN